MTPVIWHLLVGGAFIPTGIGALAWEQDNQLSGTLSGEYDGILQPPLTCYAGWYDERNVIALDFAMVRFSSATYSDSTSFTGVGAARLGVDYRRYLPPADAGPGHIDMYGDAGLYGVLPMAADTSDAYTQEDQASADETSSELRARIGAVGARLGLGAGYRIGGPASATLGVRGTLALTRSQSLLETGYTIGLIVVPEGALTLEFRR